MKNVLIITFILLSLASPLARSAQPASVPDPLPSTLVFSATTFSATQPITNLELEKLNLQLQQWQNQVEQWRVQNTQEERKFWWARLGIFGATLALLFTGWRTWVFHQQVVEQRLASYRKELFSDSPGAVIAAAMSLSPYPREAKWLIMRWAQEYQKFKQKKIAKLCYQFGNDNTDYEQFVYDELYKKGIGNDQEKKILVAVQDALNNMSKRYSWCWLGWGYRLSIINFFSLDSKIKLHNYKAGMKSARYSNDKIVNKWKKYLYKKLLYILDTKIVTFRVRGLRLEQTDISIEIGPIELDNLFMFCAESSRIELPRAHLNNANLTMANLEGANLKRVLLLWAVLAEVDLTEADLVEAVLICANMTGSSLTMANLRGADLSCADMSWADLTGANLSMADLSSANLTGADMRDANFRKANLEGVNMGWVLLEEADLKDIDYHEILILKMQILRT